MSLVACRCLNAASWPVFRAAPERTGAIEERAEPVLSPGWRFTIQGGFVSSPVVYKGIVYCGGRDGSVWAWDAATGEAVWQYSTEGWIDATPCVSSGTVYVPSRDGHMYAFDRLTGELRWKTHTGSADCSSPVFHGGKVYSLSGHPNRTITVFDAGTGNVTAAYPVSQYGFSSPAVLDCRLFFGTNDGRFHCLDLDTGSELWDVPTRGGVYYATIAAGPDAVYAASGGDERRLFCLRPGTGDVLWRSRRLADETSVISSVSLSDEKVLVACSEGSALKLFSFPIDATSQDAYELWCATIGVAHRSGIVSSPAVAGGTVYIGSGDGYLYAINAANGSFIAPATGGLSAAPTGYYLCYDISPSTGIVSSPAVSNGWIYTGTSDGIFHALRAGKVAALSAPDNGDTVVNAAVIEGTVAEPGFTGFTLEYGAGTDPAGWTAIAAGTQPVSGGPLANWNPAALPDGVYALRLTVNGDETKRAVNRVTVDNTPQRPFNLVAADALFDGGGRVALSWNASPDETGGDGDVTGYRVYRSSFPGGYAFLAALGRGVTAHIDTDCPPQTTFYYVVTALDASSESPVSDPAAGFSVVDGVEIAPETGGTIQLVKDGMVTEVIIEPGTFDRPVWVGARIPDTYPETGTPASAGATRVVREFGRTPDDAPFLKPVTIRLPYRDAEVADMHKERLRIYWWDELKGAWRIVNTSLPESGTVSARVPHFSLYRIMEYVPGREELLEKDKVYTYPNPAKGDRVSFKFYLGDTADVTIDVYNVAGELVAHLEQTDNPAGIVSELGWDVSRVASGAYVYRLEARSAAKTKSVKKKLAIIH